MPFIESIRNLIVPETITSIEQKTATGNFVPAQRELLAAYALHIKADFLLMSDDDMVVPADAIGRLLEPFADAAVGITGALCYSRDGIRPMAVSHWSASDTTVAIPAFGNSEPVRVDGIGFGLAMIRCSTFAQMEPPYFPVQVFIEQAAAQVRVCNEDFLFCSRLREANWSVMLHPGVKCGHYDRASGMVYPLIWEDPATSDQERMLVREGSGEIMKKPFDASLSRVQERHLQAHLEYVIVD